VTAGVCAPEVGPLHQLPARYSGEGLGRYTHGTRMRLYPVSSAAVREII